MIRTILIPDSTTISISVPAEYVGKEVEIVVFEKGEVVNLGFVPKKKVSFSAISIDTRGYKFSREEASER